MASQRGSASSFYAVLGVKEDSSDVEIRSAYRKLAKKWHPDKWSKDRSLAEQAKLRFQEIQEAYSVLSDNTKRAMYDVGIYDSEDDVDGFSDFLDEMATMMANVKEQGNAQDSLEELQQTFVKMVNDNWVSSDGFKQSELPTKKEGANFENNDLLKEIGEEWCGDESFYDLLNDEVMGEEWWGDDTLYGLHSNLHDDNDLYSAIQSHHQIAPEEKDLFINNKHKRTGLEIYSFSQGSGLNSYPSTTFVA